MPNGAARRPRAYQRRSRCSPPPKRRRRRLTCRRRLHPGSVARRQHPARIISRPVAEVRLPYFVHIDGDRVFEFRNGPVAEACAEGGYRLAQFPDPDWSGHDYVLSAISSASARRWRCWSRRASAVYVGNLAKDLPDYEVLAKYEPPVTTRVHASDGALMAEFARERRLYLPIQAVPDRVKAAFLSAEDKNFYKHPGIDVMGLVRAVIDNLQNAGRQAPGRRIDDHPAGGEELPADQGPDLRAQDQGSDPGVPHRAGLFQGPHPRALPQRDLLRPRLLWRRRRGADLFRQVGERADGRGGRLSRRAAEGAVELPSVPHMPTARSSAATGSSTRWSRTAT